MLMRRCATICRRFARTRITDLQKRRHSLSRVLIPYHVRQSCPYATIVAVNHIIPVRFFSSGSSRDPYVILKVSRYATPKQIKLAYFREAKKCHPDLHPGACRHFCGIDVCRVLTKIHSWQCLSRQAIRKPN